MTMRCPKCRGTGRVPDARAIGAVMRQRREKAKRSLRSVARSLEVSAAYLSDLERGNRRWTDAIKAKVQALYR
jgi:transcriptional regulator with XRE-family HTH domain